MAPSSPVRLRFAVPTMGPAPPEERPEFVYRMASSPSPAAPGAGGSTVREGPHTQTVASSAPGPRTCCRGWAMIRACAWVVWRRWLAPCRVCSCSPRVVGMAQARKKRRVQWELRQPARRARAAVVAPSVARSAVMQVPSTVTIVRPRASVARWSTAVVRAFRTRAATVYAGGALNL